MEAKAVRRGVIYILANQHMPGILKIGQTTRDVEIRARELSRPTGVPIDFEIVFDEVVSDVGAAENEIHRRLSGVRINKAKEFFRIGIRDSIKLVREIAALYEVDERAESNEVEILPALESRMRRWIRREIVSVKFVQFADLCLLRITEQPDLTKVQAYQAAVDLAGIGGEEDSGQLFDPKLWTLRENVERFLDLDAYSIMMIGIRLISEEAANYVAHLVEDVKIEPPLNPGWQVSSIKYDLWNSLTRDNESVLEWLQENDARQLGER